MKLSIVVLQGNAEGKEIPVRLPQFLIGRDPQCHLRPASTLISKRHCALLMRDGKAFLRDFDSTNGTIVNQLPLKGEIEVHHGDEFQIGPLHFRVRLQASVAVDSPTPVPPISEKSATVGNLPAAPAAKPAQAKKSPADSDEDVFADMLMHIPDDPNASAQTLSGDPISTDSTIFQLPSGESAPEAKPEDTVPAAGGEASPEGEKKGEEKEKPAAKQHATSDAARSILDKYMKRPRPAAR